MHFSLRSPKQLQTLLVILALAYQLVLPAWHHGLHQVAASAGCPSHHEPGYEPAGVFPLPDDGECTVCQSLVRFSAPGLVSAAVSITFSEDTADRSSPLHDATAPCRFLCGTSPRGPPPVS